MPRADDPDPRGHRLGGSERLGAKAPGGRSTPAGIDRARASSSAPPRAGARRAPAPRRPDLPVEEPHLPRSVRREIQRVLGPGPKAADVALALSIGADAIDLDRIDVALEMLSWAKHEAPRVAAIREAYGIARYLSEDFAAALTELQAYRRMTGRTDQNHLLADCLRGLGRDTERVAESVEAMLADTATPADRQDEGVIVWAAALADEGQLASARSLVRRRLQRRLEGDDDAVLTARLRLLVIAADLADRDGDERGAAAYRERIAMIEPDLSTEE